MYRWYKVEVPAYKINFVVKTKNNRVVDPDAIEHLNHLLIDYEHRFSNKKWDYVKRHIESEFRTNGAKVTEIDPPARYS